MLVAVLPFAAVVLELLELLEPRQLAPAPRLRDAPAAVPART